MKKFDLYPKFSDFRGSCNAIFIICPTVKSPSHNIVKLRKNWGIENLKKCICPNIAYQKFFPKSEKLEF